MTKIGNTTKPDKIGNKATEDTGGYFTVVEVMMTSSNGKIFRVTGPCAGNSPVTGEIPVHRPVTQSLDVFFDLRLNKRLSNQS